MHVSKWTFWPTLTTESLSPCLGYYCQQKHAWGWSLQVEWKNKQTMGSCVHGLKLIGWWDFSCKLFDDDVIYGTFSWVFSGSSSIYKTPRTITLSLMFIRVISTLTFHLHADVEFCTLALSTLQVFFDTCQQGIVKLCGKLWVCWLRCHRGW